MPQCAASYSCWRSVSMARPSMLVELSPCLRRAYGMLALCPAQGGAAAEGMDDEAAAESAKEEADARSVFVNNVDFGTTPEELQQVFATCGTVNRVTILADKFGTPKVSPFPSPAFAHCAPPPPS